MGGNHIADMASPRSAGITTKCGSHAAWGLQIAFSEHPQRERASYEAGLLQELMPGMRFCNQQNSNVSLRVSSNMNIAVNKQNIANTNETQHVVETSGGKLFFKMQPLLL